MHKKVTYMNMCCFSCMSCVRVTHSCIHMDAWMHARLYAVSLCHVSTLMMDTYCYMLPYIAV